MLLATLMMLANECLKRSYTKENRSKLLVTYMPASNVSQEMII